MCYSHVLHLVIVKARRLSLVHNMAAFVTEVAYFFLWQLTKAAEPEVP